MSIRWVACECMTGQALDELPDLDVPTVGVTMCDTWSGTGTIPMEALDLITPTYGAADGFGDGGFGDTAFGGDANRVQVGWRDLTAPWARYLVAIDDQDQPVWGGWVVSRTFSQDDSVQLGLASWEAYLDRRYVADGDYPGAEQCELIRSIVNATPGGWPAFQWDVTAGSTLRDRTYADTDDKTILSAMQELAGVAGGPEWTVRWVHLTDPERYMPVLTVADHLGSQPTAGMAPSVVLDMPGNLASFQLADDWSQGAGANWVVATTSASGDVRPQSDPASYADPVRPRIEFRFTPATAIDDLDVLQGHATAALAKLKDGQGAWSLTAHVDDVDAFAVGDVIGYQISHPAVCDRDQSGDLIPVASTGRAVGWERSLDGVETITPILASTEIYDQEADQ